MLSGDCICRFRGTNKGEAPTMETPRWEWIDLDSQEFGNHVVHARGAAYRGETVYVVIEEQVREEPARFRLGVYATAPSGQKELVWADDFTNRGAAEAEVAEGMDETVRMSEDE